MMSQPPGEERRVVPFAVPPGRVRRRPEEAAGRGAILFFTGVRYERDERDSAAPLHVGPSTSAGSRRGR